MWMISTCHFIFQFKNKLLLSSKAVLAMVVEWKDINLSLTRSYNLKKTTNDGNLFSFIFFVNSIYTSD